jgi:antitoxin component YwqK of YwqJK toxin-antitoxin module
MHNLDFQATTYPNGKFASQTMCNEDKTDGFRVRWYESGKIKSSAEYKYGKPDGLYTAWYENGNKSAEINYLDGHRHGKCKLWHKDGSKRSEVTYDNGKMNNLWVAWHGTGQIKKAVLFKDCRKKSEATWYSNGNIKYNSELGSEYFNRQLYKFSDVSYGEWVNYYSHSSDDDFFSNVRGPMGEGVRYPVLMTFWYKSGQKSHECIQYGYEDSTIYWHENGQKSFEAGKNKGDPNIHWNNQGVKEYECLYDFDSGELVDWKIFYKFFDADEHHIATIIQAEDFEKFIQWEFFDVLDNKLYEYKYSYPKGMLITDDELWDVWLNSKCDEFIKTLKSVEKYKSVFCRIYNYNL